MCRVVISTVPAFGRTELVDDNVGINRRGVLNRTRDGGVLQQAVLDS